MHFSKHAQQEDFHRCHNNTDLNLQYISCYLLSPREKAHLLTLSHYVKIRYQTQNTKDPETAVLPESFNEGEFSLTGTRLRNCQYRWVRVPSEKFASKADTIFKTKHIQTKQQRHIG